MGRLRGFALANLRLGYHYYPLRAQITSEPCAGSGPSLVDTFTRRYLNHHLPSTGRMCVGDSPLSFHAPLGAPPSLSTLPPRPRSVSSVTPLIRVADPVLTAAHFRSRSATVLLRAVRQLCGPRRQRSEGVGWPRLSASRGAVGWPSWRLATGYQLLRRAARWLLRQMASWSPLGWPLGTRPLGRPAAMGGGVTVAATDGGRALVGHPPSPYPLPTTATAYGSAR